MGHAPLLFFGNLAGGGGGSELPALPPHAQGHALKAGRSLTYVLVLEPQSRAISYRFPGRPALKASEGMNTAPKVTLAPSPPRPLGRPLSACTAHLAPQPLLSPQPTPKQKHIQKTATPDAPQPCAQSPPGAAPSLPWDGPVLPVLDNEQKSLFLASTTVAE